jgi:TraT complement resistance protein
MNGRLYICLVLVTLVAALSACSAVRSSLDHVGSGLNTIVNPDAEKIKCGVVWNKHAPRVGRSQDRTVFVVMEDITGIEIPSEELESRILSKLESKGYEVVDDIDDAYYRLEIFLRYFGPNPKSDRGRNRLIAGGLGAIAGGTLGYALSHGMSHSATIPITGAAALGGGFLGMGIAEGMKVKEYDFVADVNLYEKHEKPVKKTVRERESEGQGTATSGSFEGGLQESGSSSDTLESRMEYTVNETYRNHKRRVTVWVQKARLSEEEAHATAIEKMTRAFGGLLPRVRRG